MTQEKQLSSVRVLAVLVGLSVLSACSAQGTVIGLGAVVGRILLQERDAGDALSDTDIEIGILTRILEFSPEAAATVSVTSIEGRVLLTGDVDGAEDGARIVEIAWISPQVGSVANELTVGLGGGIGQASDDLQLAAAIRLRLVRDLGIADINFIIAVDGGVVHLAGLARDREELRSVIWHVRRTAGVVHVVSHVLTLDDPRRVARGV
ncbi:MAG: osmotically-inducible protein OsmY [Paracoccaceae bacterium]|jgi:osmotically-inducible protein OsmY